MPVGKDSYVSTKSSKFARGKGFEESAVRALEVRALTICFPQGSIPSKGMIYPKIEKTCFTEGFSVIHLISLKTVPVCFDNNLGLANPPCISEYRPTYKQA